MIVVNGDVVAQGSQFSLNDVEVVTATVDIESVRTYRCSASRGLQASKQSPYVRLDLDMRLSRSGEEAEPGLVTSEFFKPRFHAPEEEISLGPACWLWDYLRRCGAAGFFLPLSGGIDSCSTAIIVHSMCREVLKAVKAGNEQVIKDVRRLCAKPEDSDWLPTSSQEICKYVLLSIGCGRNSCRFLDASSTPVTWARKIRVRRQGIDLGGWHRISAHTTSISTLTLW